MTERLKFIAACEQGLESFSHLCRQFGISRKTGYKWLARFEQEGLRGLEEQPRAALAHPGRVDVQLVDRIVEARKQHPRWGPKKLRAWLADKEPQLVWPACSTIGEILKRQGLVHPPRRKLRVPLHPLALAECGAPNDVWCADYKGHFRLGDKSWCYPLTVSDLYSRYWLKSEALPSTCEDLARVHFERAFVEFGLPFRIRTDNGTPFASTAPGGLSSLSIWWIKLEIVPERIWPGRPQQNGAHERLHRTMKEELFPVELDLSSEQRALDRIRRGYNEERPHEALGQQPPSRHYAHARRSYPAALRSPEYGEEVEVRRVNESGAIKWSGHYVQLTPLLGGEPVGLRQTDETRMEVHYGPLLLGTLDPTSSKPRLQRVQPAASAQPQA